MTYTHIDPNGNPVWPPEVGTVIAVKMQHDRDMYIGKVIRDIDAGQTVIKLLNSNKQFYYDKNLEKFKRRLNTDDVRGYLTVVPSYGWRCLQADKVDMVLRRLSEQSIIPSGADLTKATEDVYSDTRANNTKTCDEGVEDPFDPNIFYNDTVRLDNLFDDAQADDSFVYSGNARSYGNSVTESMDRMLRQNIPIVTLSQETDDHPSDEKYLTSKQLTVDNLMKDPDDIKKNGELIIRAVYGKFNSNKDSPIDDLQCVYHNGYVHITREGTQLKDVITRDLVPGLKIFDWQYGKVIEYDTLKHVILNSEAQGSIKRTADEVKEVTRILAQEYMVILQPQPKYLWWCLKRVIACWYSSQLMLRYVKKIKVIVNMWRADSSKEHNIRYGTRPMIVIYPRYGVDPAAEVYTTISTHFSRYHNAGWRCSKPSYCQRVSDLLWVANGNTDLKYYYRFIRKTDNVGSNTFRDSFSKVTGSTDLIQAL